ncbi:MAG: threonine synthase [Campylobacterales bacterium]|nr:threonine synthase [Campylobacterales bacterium]
MQFIETRGNDGVHPSEVTFSHAILSPIASFGGLYVPKGMPRLGIAYLESHLDSPYKMLALDLMRTLRIDIDEVTIEAAVALYDRFDDPAHPVPVVKVGEGLFVSELYHGPTRAFKDMALQPFGHILSHLAQSRGEEYLILAATSGDTGPAALETFKNKPGVRVACLYPNNGTSDVQRLQMVTEEGANLKVIGIDGNFDDAQSALKSLLGSPSFKAKLKEKNILLSAANSVNFGRIIFQIVYHIHSYLELVRQGEIAMGEKIYLNVPSGNFGNALGAYYAMKMGLPVKQIIIASNENDVLTRFISYGSYDLRDRTLIPTTSPAMDILISSNIERVLYDLFGPQRTRELMVQLERERYYSLSAEEHELLQTIFVADFCNGDEGKGYIKRYFERGYLMDPHTATCFKAQESCASEAYKSVIYSTAEWTKFSPTIINAISGAEGSSDLEALEAIASKGNIAIPSMIKALFGKPIKHATVIDKADIESEILSFI